MIPFLALLTNPDPLFELPLFNSLASILDLDNSKNLLIPASLVFAITAVLAASIRILSLWINKRLASSIGSDLSFEAYRRTLYQPYQYMLSVTVASFCQQLLQNRTDCFYA